MAYSHVSSILHSTLQRDYEQLLNHFECSYRCFGGGQKGIVFDVDRFQRFAITIGAIRAEVLCEISCELASYTRQRRLLQKDGVVDSVSALFGAAVPSSASVFDLKKSKALGVTSNSPGNPTGAISTGAKGGLLSNDSLDHTSTSEDAELEAILLSNTSHISVHPQDVSKAFYLATTCPILTSPQEFVLCCGLLGRTITGSDRQDLTYATGVQLRGGVGEQGPRSASPAKRSAAPEASGHSGAEGGIAVGTDDLVLQCIQGLQELSGLVRVWLRRVVKTHSEPSQIALANLLPIDTEVSRVLWTYGEAIEDMFGRHARPLTSFISLRKLQQQEAAKRLLNNGGSGGTAGQKVCDLSHSSHAVQRYKGDDTVSSAECVLPSSKAAIEENPFIMNKEIFEYFCSEFMLVPQHVPHTVTMGIFDFVAKTTRERRTERQVFDQISHIDAGNAEEKGARKFSSKNQIGEGNIVDKAISTTLDTSIDIEGFMVALVHLAWASAAEDRNERYLTPSAKLQQLFVTIIAASFITVFDKPMPCADAGAHIPECVPLRCTPSVITINDGAIDQKAPTKIQCYAEGGSSLVPRYEGVFTCELQGEDFGSLGRGVWIFDSMSHAIRHVSETEMEQRRCPFFFDARGRDVRWSRCRIVAEKVPVVDAPLHFIAANDNGFAQSSDTSNSPSLSASGGEKLLGGTRNPFSTTQPSPAQRDEGLLNTPLTREDSSAVPTHVVGETRRTLSIPNRFKITLYHDVSIMMAKSFHDLPFVKPRTDLLCLERERVVIDIVTDVCEQLEDMFVDGCSLVAFNHKGRLFHHCWEYLCAKYRLYDALGEWNVEMLCGLEPSFPNLRVQEGLGEDSGGGASVSLASALGVANRLARSQSTRFGDGGTNGSDSMSLAGVQTLASASQFASAANIGGHSTSPMSARKSMFGGAVSVSGGSDRSGGWAPGASRGAGGTRMGGAPPTASRWQQLGVGESVAHSNNPKLKALTSLFMMLAKRDNAEVGAKLSLSREGFTEAILRIALSKDASGGSSEGINVIIGDILGEVGGDGSGLPLWLRGKQRSFTRSDASGGITVGGAVSGGFSASRAHSIVSSKALGAGARGGGYASGASSAFGGVVPVGGFSSYSSSSPGRTAALRVASTEAHTITSLKHQNAALKEKISKMSQVMKSMALSRKNMLEMLFQIRAIVSYTFVGQQYSEEDLEALAYDPLSPPSQSRTVLGTSRVEKVVRAAMRQAKEHGRQSSIAFNTNTSASYANSTVTGVGALPFNQSFAEGGIAPISGGYSFAPNNALPSANQTPSGVPLAASPIILLNSRQHPQSFAAQNQPKGVLTGVRLEGFLLDEGESQTAFAALQPKSLLDSKSDGITLPPNFNANLQLQSVYKKHLLSACGRVINHIASSTELKLLGSSKEAAVVEGECEDTPCAVSAADVGSAQEVELLRQIRRKPSVVDGFLEDALDPTKKDDTTDFCIDVLKIKREVEALLIENEKALRARIQNASSGYARGIKKNNGAPSSSPMANNTFAPTSAAQYALNSGGYDSPPTPPKSPSPSGLMASPGLPSRASSLVPGGDDLGLSLNVGEDTTPSLASLDPASMAASVLKLRRQLEQQRIKNESDKNALQTTLVQRSAEINDQRNDINKLNIQLAAMKDRAERLERERIELHETLTATKKAITTSSAGSKTRGSAAERGVNEAKTSASLATPEKHEGSIASAAAARDVSAKSSSQLLAGADATNILNDTPNTADKGRSASSQPTSVFESATDQEEPQKINAKADPARRRLDKSDGAEGGQPQVTPTHFKNVKQASGRKVAPPNRKSLEKSSSSSAMNPKPVRGKPSKPSLSVGLPRDENVSSAVPFQVKSPSPQTKPPPIDSKKTAVKEVAVQVNLLSAIESQEERQIAVPSEVYEHTNDSLSPQLLLAERALEPRPATPPQRRFSNELDTFTSTQNEESDELPAIASSPTAKPSPSEGGIASSASLSESLQRGVAPSTSVADLKLNTFEGYDGTFAPSPANMLKRVTFVTTTLSGAPLPSFSGVGQLGFTNTNKEGSVVSSPPSAIKVQSSIKPATETLSAAGHTPDENSPLLLLPSSTSSGLEDSTFAARLSKQNSDVMSPRQSEDTARSQQEADVQPLPPSAQPRSNSLRALSDANAGGSASLLDASQVNGSGSAFGETFMTIVSSETSRQAPSSPSVSQRSEKDSTLRGEVLRSAPTVAMHAALSVSSIDQQLWSPSTVSEGRRTSKSTGEPCKQCESMRRSLSRLMSEIDELKGEHRSLRELFLGYSEGIAQALAASLTGNEDEGALVLGMSLPVGSDMVGEHGRVKGDDTEVDNEEPSNDYSSNLLRTLRRVSIEKVSSSVRPLPLPPRNKRSLDQYSEPLINASKPASAANHRQGVPLDVLFGDRQAVSLFEVGRKEGGLASSHSHSSNLPTIPFAHQPRPPSSDEASVRIKRSTLPTGNNSERRPQPRPPLEEMQRKMGEAVAAKARDMRLAVFGEDKTQTFEAPELHGGNTNDEKDEVVELFDEPSPSLRSPAIPPSVSPLKARPPSSNNAPEKTGGQLKRVPNRVPVTVDFELTGKGSSLTTTCSSNVLSRKEEVKPNRAARLDGGVLLSQYLASTRPPRNSTGVRSEYTASGNDDGNTLIVKSNASSSNGGNVLPPPKSDRRVHEGPTRLLSSAHGSKSEKNTPRNSAKEASERSSTAVTDLALVVGSPAHVKGGNRSNSGVATPFAPAEGTSAARHTKKQRQMVIEKAMREGIMHMTNVLFNSRSKTDGLSSPLMEGGESSSSPFSPPTVSYRVHVIDPNSGAGVDISRDEYARLLARALAESAVDGMFGDGVSSRHQRTRSALAGVHSSAMAASPSSLDWAARAAQRILMHDTDEEETEKRVAQRRRRRQSSPHASGEAAQGVNRSPFRDRSIDGGDSRPAAAHEILVKEMFAEAPFRKLE